MSGDEVADLLISGALEEREKSSYDKHLTKMVLWFHNGFIMEPRGVECAPSLSKIFPTTCISV